MIQWAGIFLNSISGVLLGILAFTFTLTGIASLAFRLVSGSEALKMIVTGFAIYMFPVIVDWFVSITAAAISRLRDYIWL